MATADFLVRQAITLSDKQIPSNTSPDHVPLVILISMTIRNPSYFTSHRDAVVEIDGGRDLPFRILSIKNGY